MAFTNVWSNVIPAGSDALSTADNQIRQLRLDIQERMDGGLVADWTADPLVLTRLVAGLTGPPDVARVWSGAAISVLTGVAAPPPLSTVSVPGPRGVDGLEKLKIPFIFLPLQFNFVFKDTKGKYIKPLITIINQTPNPTLRHKP